MCQGSPGPPPVSVMSLGELTGLRILSCSWLITAKVSKAKSPKGKCAWGEVWGKAGTSFQDPLPVESHGMCVTCDNRG